MPLTDFFLLFMYLLKADDNTIVNGCLLFGMPPSHACVFFAIRINKYIFCNNERSIEIIQSVACV